MSKRTKKSAVPTLDINKLHQDKLEEAYEQVSAVILSLVTPLSADDPADDIDWLETLLHHEPQVIDLLHLRQQIREAQRMVEEAAR